MLRAFVNTIVIALISVVLAFVVSMTFGIIAAYRAGKLSDRLITADVESLDVSIESAIEDDFQGIRGGKLSKLAIHKALDSAYWFIPGADVTPGRAASEYPYRGRAASDPDLTALHERPEFHRLLTPDS